MPQQPPERKYLTTQQVADVFHVHPNTVVLWAKNGRLAAIRTPGGHRRFDPEVVEALRSATQEAGVA